MAKAIIVGAGLAGSVAATLLKSAGYDVEIFEKRTHLGGNCYDKFIEGVCVHKYGPHGFHTDNKQVWDFLNQFTKFNNVSLRVQADTAEGRIPIPFNKAAMKIVGEKTPEEIRALIFVDYSEKMWGLKWKEIPKSITGRLPTTRESFDDRYHLDKYQGIPINGYTEMFKNMLDGITVHTGTSNKDWRHRNYDALVYTGKIDEYFNYTFGQLGYRSLRFEQFSAPKRNIMQLNQCNKKPWTRDIDHSHWLGQNVERSIFTREYPIEHNKTNVPFYPKNFGVDREACSKYQKINKKNNVIFLGRLATYKYMDMDDCVAQVLQRLKKIKI